MDPFTGLPLHKLRTRSAAPESEICIEHVERNWYSSGHEVEDNYIMESVQVDGTGNDGLRCENRRDKAVGLHMDPRPGHIQTPHHESKLGEAASRHDLSTLPLQAGILTSQQPKKWPGEYPCGCR